jgi:hypothetical protein
MHAYTSYNITINGGEEAIHAIGNVLTDTITDVDFDIGNVIEIEDTYDCVFDEEVCALAKAMAKAAPDANFVMEGVIDTSESAGEYMDFRMELVDGKLTAAFSVWYREAYMDDFEDYEEFCECVMECTEEEYDKFCEQEFIFILQKFDGDVVVAEVPLENVEELDY